MRSVTPPGANGITSWTARPWGFAGAAVEAVHDRPSAAASPRCAVVA
ncbi:Uncharacterised protein [Bordetella pertussis]|nr:Uncharacterised protein [Bordetella pertussis]